MKENLLNQSNAFENMVLNMDTNKNQNFELFLGAADFAKILAVEDVPLWTSSPPAGFAKKYD